MSENAGNETVAVGGRPGVGLYYDNPTQSDMGLPPKAVRGSTHQVSAPEMPPALPLIGVSRQVVGAEILRLRSTEAAIERDLSRGPFGANGAPNPYLVQRHAELRAELEHVRESIERLSNLSDLGLRQRAYELGAR